MVADLQFCSYALAQQQEGIPCHIDEYMSAVNQDQTYTAAIHGRSIDILGREVTL